MGLLHTTAGVLNKLLALLGVRLVRARAAPSLQSYGPEIIYNYSSFSIRLPGNHMLPTYQAACKRYDRFLPHLAKFLGAGDVVIDVGANCGDTVAGMVDSNPDLHYLCIEPDEEFFSYLEMNCAAIRAGVRGASISLVKSLVGKGVVRAKMSGSSGTKHAIPLTRKEEDISAVADIASVPLDRIVARELQGRRVRLLKSDVDGYDWDVIDSAENTLQKDRPILFFECQYENKNQKVHYEATFGTLAELGYKQFWLFDNFGDIVLRTDSFAVVKQLIDYVWRQNAQGTTRTIFYYDVLACAPSDEQCLMEAIEEYLALV